MPFSDHVDYMTVLHQMYQALCDLNVEADFVRAGDSTLSRYKVLFIPPLYSASDAELHQISDYVKSGGQVVMAFKSGFTNEYSSVRDSMAPGPLRAAAGFHYQEFTNLVEPEHLTPDPYGIGEQNQGSVWQEFLIPDTAEVVASVNDPYWKFPAITRNHFGQGTLTYEGTFLTDALQREVIREALKRSGLTGPDQDLPENVRVRHGRNAQGVLLHYYLNFSGKEESFAYPYKNGLDLLTGSSTRHQGSIKLKPWDLAIVAEQ
jgi:beta-galactosidase